MFCSADVLDFPGWDAHHNHEGLPGMPGSLPVINAKGGCGKSTIADDLAAACAGEGYRSLLIDLDPQKRR